LKLGFSQILDSLYSAFWQCSRIGYNSAESELIQMKSEAHQVHCWGLALVDFGCDPHSSNSWTARHNFWSDK